MTITTATAMTNVTYGENGALSITTEKRVLNGDRLISAEPHNFMLEPGEDIDAKIAQVNAHLADMGYAPMRDDDIAHLKADATRRWTEEVVAAYQKRRQEALDRLASQAARKQAEPA